MVRGVVHEGLAIAAPAAASGANAIGERREPPTGLVDHREVGDLVRCPVDLVRHAALTDGRNVVLDRDRLSSGLGQGGRSSILGIIAVAFEQLSRIVPDFGQEPLDSVTVIDVLESLPCRRALVKGIKEGREPIGRIAQAPDIAVRGDVRQHPSRIPQCHQASDRIGDGRQIVARVGRGHRVAPPVGGGNPAAGHNIERCDRAVKVLETIFAPDGRHLTSRLAGARRVPDAGGLARVEELPAIGSDVVEIDPSKVDRAHRLVERVRPALSDR